MAIRIGGMLALVVGKALVGHEEMHAWETLFTVAELTAVFFTGVHTAHWAHKKEATDG
jgi:hypothetical protein